MSVLKSLVLCAHGALQISDFAIVVHVVKPEFRPFGGVVRFVFLCSVYCVCVVVVVTNSIEIK